MDIDVASSSAGAYAALENGLESAWLTLARFPVAASPSRDLFGYFQALDRVVAGLNEAGSLRATETIMRHVDYLAERAGFRSKAILNGQRFSARPPVVLDTLENIGDVLREVLRKQPAEAPDGIPAEVFSLILEAEANLDGWCSREKALIIARTVLRERPEICVEIGIFGGRSLVPCAAALRHIGSGVIYGIEAWNPDTAVENATTDANDDWWSKFDFSKIKSDFYRFVSATSLVPHVRLIEAPSGRASGLFDRIDYLHIDGSHSTINAAEDVILYARKVRSGGIIVFDDVNWNSTAPARELLDALCTPVTFLKDPETGLDICAVMRRR